jgi:hypothetical protein
MLAEQESWAVTDSAYSKSTSVPRDESSYPRMSVGSRKKHPPPAGGRHLPRNCYPPSSWGSSRDQRLPPPEKSRPPRPPMPWSPFPIAGVADPMGLPFACSDRDARMLYCYGGGRRWCARAQAHVAGRSKTQRRNASGRTRRKQGGLRTMASWMINPGTWQPLQTLSMSWDNLAPPATTQSTTD